MFLNQTACPGAAQQELSYSVPRSAGSRLSGAPVEQPTVMSSKQRNSLVCKDQSVNVTLVVSKHGTSTADTGPGQVQEDTRGLRCRTIH